jgi:hypothetical protein
MRKVQLSLLGALLLSLAGCGPTHFQTRAGRVLETVTAVGAAAAGAAASHSQNEYLSTPVVP